MTIITYSLEIVKSLPTWINSDQVSIHKLSQFAETLTRLIQLSPVSFDTAELCFQVIDFIASEFVSKYFLLFYFNLYLFFSRKHMV